MQGATIPAINRRNLPSLTNVFRGSINGGLTYEQSQMVALDFHYIRFITYPDWASRKQYGYFRNAEKQLCRWEEHPDSCPEKDGAYMLITTVC